MELTRSGQIVQSFLSGNPPRSPFDSPQFKQALVADLKTFPERPFQDPQGSDAIASGSRADDFFNQLLIPAAFQSSPTAQIRTWERTLEILRAADEERYRALHKGTPFYFLGIASYLAEDFERAMYYIDCGLGEDIRLHGERSYLIPTGMFIRLDDIPENQFGRDLVRDTKHVLTGLNQRLSAEGGDTLTLESYRAKLVNQSMFVEPALRSCVTALLSFVLELRPRMTQLNVASGDAGTGEPFFLHLFKGGLLCETLLKMSPHGIRIRASKPKATLNDLLTDGALVADLGLARSPQGLNAHTFDDILGRLRQDISDLKPFRERAVRAVWGVRNATGHNLAWPKRPTTEEYDQLFLLVLGSLALIIERLYPPRLLPTGHA